MTMINTNLLICIINVLIVKTLLSEYQGRLKSQFRVLPSNGMPRSRYACPSNGLVLCTHNRRGYHKCKNGVLGSATMCPERTQCGCHFDGICHLNETEVCVSMQIEYPMAEKATFYYHGYTTKNFLALFPRDTKEKKLLWGVIKQDVKAGKYLQINTNQYEPYHTFELVVPNGKNQFVKFTGIDGSCHNTTSTIFRPFGYDIQNYHLRDVKALTKDRSLQKWTFKTGFKGSPWTDLSWKWTIMADTSTNVSLPVKSFFFEAGNGPLYKQFAFWDVSTLDAPLKDENKWYGKEPNDHDWFSIPDICKLI